MNVSKGNNSIPALSAQGAPVRAIRASPVARYGIAIGAAAAAILIRLALDPLWGVKLPFITLFPAIMLSAWLGGLWPGMVTTAFSAVAAEYFWIEPSRSWAVTDKSELLGLLIFVVVGGVISALNEAWRGAVVALAQSEDGLRITLVSIGDAVITTDDQAAVTQLNPVAQALTGWSEADAVGQPLEKVFVIVNEQSRKPAENPIPRVLREGVIAGLANHTILVSRDAREIPIDDSAAPIRAADGSVVGAVLVFRDVTERRRGERERAILIEKERVARIEAERISQELLHLQRVTDIALTNLEPSTLMRELLARICAALKSDIAAILLLEPDGRYLTPLASHGLQDETGEEFQVPVGQGIAGRIAETRRPLIIDDVGEVEVVDSSLREHVKSLVGAPLEVGGAIIGIVHVGTVAPRRFTQSDMHLLSLVAERLALTIERTHQQEAERKARIHAETAERQLRIALEAGRMGTWQWTIGNGEVKWSPGLEAIHAFAPGTFPGTFEAFRNEIHPDDCERVVKEITETLQQGRDHHILYRIVRADGALRWVEGRGQLFNDAAGRPERMVGVCSDVTERMQVETASVTLPTPTAAPGH